MSFVRFRLTADTFAFDTQTPAELKAADKIVGRKYASQDKVKTAASAHYVPDVAASCLMRFSPGTVPTREAAANHYNDRKERFTAASTTDLRHARYAGIASLLTSSSLHFQTTSQTLF